MTIKVRTKLKFINIRTINKPYTNTNKTITICYFNSGFMYSLKSTSKDKYRLEASLFPAGYKSAK